MARNQVLDSLRGFARFVRNPLWRGKGEDYDGLAIDVSNALEEEEELFREISSRMDGGVLVVDVEWLRSEPPAVLESLDKDFYRVFGHLGMDAQFVARTVEPEAVVFNIVLAATEVVRLTELLQIRLVGERIVRWINDLREWQGKEFPPGRAKTREN